ncbi:hypothetical protein CBX98_25200, partial [Vibrio sp. T9]
CASWAMARLGLLADGARLGKQGGRAGERIPRAEHPRVVMHASNHPFVGILATAKRADHVVKRAPFPGRSHFEMHRCIAADVIRERQAALPSAGNHAATEGSKEMHGIAIPYRHDGQMQIVRMSVGLKGLRT